MSLYSWMLSYWIIVEFNLKIAIKCPILLFIWDHNEMIRFFKDICSFWIIPLIELIDAFHSYLHDFPINVHFRFPRKRKRKRKTEFRFRFPRKRKTEMEFRIPRKRKTEFRRNFRGNSAEIFFYFSETEFPRKWNLISAKTLHSALSIAHHVSNNMFFGSRNSNFTLLGICVDAQCA